MNLNNITKLIPFKVKLSPSIDHDWAYRELSLYSHLGQANWIVVAEKGGMVFIVTEGEIPQWVPTRFITATDCLNLIKGKINEPS